MKLCLASKPVGTLKSYPHRQLEGPRTLVCNNWLTRNNSSNVKAILYPDTKNPRKPIKNIPTEEVYKKESNSSNTCYCNEKPTKPTIFNRPSKCLSLEEFEQTLEGKSSLKSKRSLYCFCKGTRASANNIDLTDAETLRKFRDELDEVSSNLAITDHRRATEFYRERRQAEYEREIRKYDEEIDKESECEHLYEDRDDVQTRFSSKKTSGSLAYTPDTDSRTFKDVSTKKSLKCSCRCGPTKTLKSSSTCFLDSDTDTRTFKDFAALEPVRDAKTVKCCPSCKCRTTEQGSCTCLRKTLEPEEASIAELSTSKFGNSIDESTYKMRQFRDENYFETHEVDGYMDKEIPEHTCVHQFKLDERLLPQAVSFDRYGRSRCTVCSKPMETKETSEIPLFSDKITREKIKKFAKCIELGLKPHEITIGASANIELMVKPSEIVKHGKLIGSYHRPCITNSFALRQQKMTYWKH